MDAAVEDCKEIFGENIPYVTEDRVGGRVIIFNDHFLETVREALTTGCVARMNASELLVFNDFVRYEDKATYRDITNSDDYIAEALDEWLTREVMCLSHPYVNECYGDTRHTWTECSVN